MKKAKSFLLLALGFILGWIPASHITKARFDRWAGDWSPEVREQIVEMAKFTDTLSTEELESLHQNTMKYLENSRMEIDMMQLHRALISIQIQNAMLKGNAEGLDNLLKQSQEMFLESYDEGHYIGKDYQELADSTAKKIREFDKTSGQQITAPNPAGPVR